MVIYLDDIIIYGVDPQVVWRETKEVIQCLSAAGFMINITKSKFLVSSLKMLGFLVGGNVMKPNYIRLEAVVRSSSSPKTVRDV